MAEGHLDPEYPITRINQKGVYRTDLGDLQPLCDSLTTLGLLTPVVVTTEGDLICGKRRLAAATRLGWATVPVWIPDKVSRNLRLIALYDDETLRKTLTPIEQAGLFAEYEQLYAEQARLRQESTRFTPGNAAAKKKGNGSAESAEPFAGGLIAAPRPRELAARAVTGTTSHSRLSQIRELQQIAASDTEDPWVRQAAVESLVELNQDGKVNPRWQHVKVQQHLAALDAVATDSDQPAEVRQAAATAVQAVYAHETLADQLTEAKHAAHQIADLQHHTPAPVVPPVDPHSAERRQLRVLATQVRREHGWWDRNPPTLLADHGDQETWDLFTSLRDGISHWVNLATALRDGESLE